MGTGPETRRVRILAVMKELTVLFEQNKRWAEKQKAEDPECFSRTANGQSPKYLWIGCADSRIPAEEILGLRPGELFVHRNVANLFPNTDFNSLSVLQFAVDALGVEHVIVCGHYGCGGIAAAMEQQQFGVVDHWLQHIRDIYAQERAELDSIADHAERQRRLVELNVRYQVKNVCHTTVVQNAWSQGKKLCVHGWVYDLKTGLLKDLQCDIGSLGEIEEPHRTLREH